MKLSDSLPKVHLNQEVEEGVISFFDRYFVKTDLFEKTYSQILHEAFDSRQDNDYEDFYHPSEFEATTQYEHAVQFLEEVTKKYDLFLQDMLALPTISS